MSTVRATVRSFSHYSFELTLEIIILSQLAFFSKRALHRDDRVNANIELKSVLSTTVSVFPLVSFVDVRVAVAILLIVT
jgi:hypothetical protein